MYEDEDSKEPKMKVGRSQFARDRLQMTRVDAERRNEDFHKVLGIC
jgi:hypothetical protein